MPDVQLVEVWHEENAASVFVVQAVAGVDAEAKRLGLLGGPGQALEFGGLSGFVALSFAVGGTV